MGIAVLEAIVDQAGSPGDDVVGASASGFWVLDGATDVGPERLLPGGSDAGWFARAADQALARAFADGADRAWPDMLGAVTAALDARFQAERSRAPVARYELPSAAAVIGRLTATDAGAVLDVVRLGDCAAIVETADGAVTALGIGRPDGADAWVAEKVRAAQSQNRASGEASQSLSGLRAALTPDLQAARSRLNTADGYGVLSVAPPPDRFITPDRLPIRPGVRTLVMTDGFARLVDVFGRYTPETLFRAACDRGLAALLAELRALEAADGHGLAHPRVKVSDDAAAMLLAFISI